ncbi:hypothetical protein LSAT2_021307 [Lamellibrachia satsuma]|nr:hypothetical protein LSAT2_021307 [Lamellibrachia satsuma]
MNQLVLPRARDGLAARCFRCDRTRAPLNGYGSNERPGSNSSPRCRCSSPVCAIPVACIRVPDGSAHDGFGPRRRIVRPCRFGPRRRMVRPTSLSLLNSATVDSAHSSSGNLSGGNVGVRVFPSVRPVSSVCGQLGRVAVVLVGPRLGPTTPAMSSQQKIAIVGIGCRFAGGIDNVGEFWKALSEGRDCSSPLPQDRFDVAAFYHPDLKKTGKLYCERGGFLKQDVLKFDRQFFKIPPDEAEHLDPQVRLLLEVTQEALEDAGMPSRSIKGSKTANIKWQDMISNTEVLQRCAKNGIEHHIKRAQLRWSGHLVRMADDRIPKAVFYGELDAGKRTRGGQRKKYKDVLKVTLKSCGVPQNTWESTAMDRALWRRTCHVGLHEFEKKRCDALREKRLRWKVTQPSSNTVTFVCRVCGRQCASRIGLFSHNRTNDTD